MARRYSLGMRIGIVGGGVSGLAAARKLKNEGMEPVLFEANERLGGRVETVEIEGCVVDTALQTFTPRGLGLEFALLRDLPQENLVRIEKPIYLLDLGRVIAGAPERNKQRRYTYQKGANEFSKLMANGLDIRLNKKVESIHVNGKMFQIFGEEFDKVILTAPGPVSELLLRTVGDKRNLSQIRYRPCLSVVVGYKKSLSPQSYSALLNVDRMSPVLWLGLEHEKCRARIPEGQSVFVAQMGPYYSAEYFEQPEKVIVSMAVSVIQKIFGTDFSTPDWTLVKRYAISQPETIALFDSINRGNPPIIIAGDGTLAGRAENAYETGLMAAEMAMQK